MAISIRERILNNIAFTALAVGPHRSVVEGRNRSDAQLEIAGLYIGDHFTLYRIQVTTPGVSGVAQVTIKDLLQSDTPSSPITITTGETYDIGALGMTFTLTFSGELQQNDLWYVKSGKGSISPPQAFINDVRWVTRSAQPPNQLRNQISVIVYEPMEDIENIDRFADVNMDILIEAWTRAEFKEIHTADYETLSQSISSLATDLKMALAADIERGGAAQNTLITSSEPHLSEASPNHSGVGITMNVFTRHRKNDPSTLI